MRSWQASGPPPTFGELLRAHRMAIQVVARRRYTNAGVTWRKQVPLSQNELARRSLVDAALVNKFEAGSPSRPKFETVERLSSGLDLDAFARAKLLAVAGHWPWPEADHETVDFLIAAGVAIVDGDWRLASPDPT
jgi:Helix-turn-helix domain